MFKPVEFSWKGQTKTIPANEVLAVIAAVEECVTFFDLASQNKKFAKVARGYSEALRMAGFNCTAEEVYSAMMGGDDDGRAAITSLIGLMIPPKEVLDEKKQEAVSIPSVTGS